MAVMTRRRRKQAGQFVDEHRTLPELHETMEEDDGEADELFLLTETDRIETEEEGTIEGAANNHDDHSNDKQLDERAVVDVMQASELDEFNAFFNCPILSSEN